MKRIFSTIIVITLLITGMYLVAAADPSDAAAQIGTAYYSSFSDALTAYPGDGAVIILHADVTTPFTLEEDLIVDLAGYNITSDIIRTAGTMYVMDSQTDDYTVEDGNGFGTVANTDFIQPAQGYLMINEEGLLSFHRVSMELTSAYLRPSTTGIYFDAQFGGDEMVKARIYRYGVAFSVAKVPTAASILADTQFKTHTGFTANTWVCGKNTTGIKSSIVENIMVTTNGDQMNSHYANKQIISVPYIQFHDDTVLLGTSDSISLKNALEAASKIWADLDEEQTSAILNMYQTFESVMSGWDIQAVKDAYQLAYEKRPLKILTIGNSFSLDSTRYLYEIAKAEGMEDITLGVAYYSGCSLSTHVSYLTANSKSYNYYWTDSAGTWKNTGANGATLQYCIKADNWDIIVLQQASASSGRPDTYNSDIQTIIDYAKTHCSNPDVIFAWNMTWAYPVEDIATDNITTVNTTSAFKNYYGSDQMTMYNAICNAVETKIATNPVFEFIFPVGTAVQNARSSWLGDPDLNRDYSHLSDYGRFMTGYVWYYVLTGKEVNTITLDKISKELRYASADRDEDILLTAQDKALILEAVKNAIEDPYQLSQSQYTVAP